MSEIIYFFIHHALNFRFKFRQCIRMCVNTIELEHEDK